MNGRRESTPLHGLSRRGIHRRALALQASGELYPKGDLARDDNFFGSLDRFSDIAFALRSRRRVLDVGAGDGLLLLLLNQLGHDCHGVDVRVQPLTRELFAARGIGLSQCNVEADPLPFPDGAFDAVTCCQVMEHLTFSPLPVLAEMRRVLTPGGVLEVDVPNAACYRNRSRLLRGKHVTWDYRKHYLLAEPVDYKGRSYFPERHNREFVRDELGLALREAGFEVFDLRWIPSMRHRSGLSRLVNLAAGVLNAVPSLRKTIIAYAKKPPG